MNNSSVLDLTIKNLKQKTELLEEKMCPLNFEIN